MGPLPVRPYVYNGKLKVSWLGSRCKSLGMICAGGIDFRVCSVNVLSEELPPSHNTPAIRPRPRVFTVTYKDMSNATKRIPNNIRTQRQERIIYYTAWHNYTAFIHTSILKHSAMYISTRPNGFLDVLSIVSLPPCLTSPSHLVPRQCPFRVLALDCRASRQ